MRILFFIFLFILSIPLCAEEFLNCESENSCSCSVQNEIKIPFTAEIRDTISPTTLYQCRELKVPESGVTSPSVECKDQTPDSLYDRAVALFPKGCGYTQKDFRVQGFRQNIQSLIRNNKITCDAHHNTMCTSAAFLAFILQLKILESKGLITHQKLLEWSDIHAAPFKYLNDQARPDLMLSSLKLGTGKTLRQGQIPQEGWPKEGDFVQLWRNDNSGHSVVFSGFLKNAQGQNTGMCFWSANKATNGYGEYCEDINNVNRIVVGRINP